MQIVLISDPLKLIYSETDNRAIESHHHYLIASMTSAFNKLGHAVECVEANSGLKDQILRIKPQVVFNRSIRKDGGSDIEFTLSLLDELNIPYTGSTAEVCINAYDKYKTKKLLREANIPTPEFCLVSDSGDIQIPQSLNFPLFVKPGMGGCSRGIDERNPVFSSEACLQVVRSTIEQNHQPALVEEFITGREFTAGILGYAPPRMLPILEIIQTASEEHKFPFRNFKAKIVEKKGETKSCPAILSPIEEERIRDLAVKAYNAIGCRDYARIDIRCDKEGNPYVLEVNALPSLTPNASSFAIMAKAAGISYENLIRAIIIYACDRYSIDPA